MRSIRLLSSSVELPSRVSSTCLLSLPARSRTRRGKRLKTYSIGIIRIDITDSCKSRALRCSCPMLVISSPWLTGSSSLERWASIDWVITSSPTRLISWSTFSTATRMLVDSATRAAGFSARATGFAAGAATSATAAAWAATATGAVSATTSITAALAASGRNAICSGSMTKHSTAVMSSALTLVSSVAVTELAPFSTSLRVPRFESSSSSRSRSLSLSPLMATRSLPSFAAAAWAGASFSTTVSFAGAAAASPLASRASWRSALQI